MLWELTRSSVRRSENFLFCHSNFPILNLPSFIIEVVSDFDARVWPLWYVRTNNLGESYMTKMKVVFSALLAALALSGPARGQELDGTLKKIKTSSTLTIGYRESAPPFSFMGPDQRVGFLWLAIS
jgi:hypothetical protein